MTENLDGVTELYPYGDSRCINKKNCYIENHNLDFVCVGFEKCPKCDEKQDLSEHTYKLKVKIEEDEGYNVLKIIGGDERIHKHFYDDSSYLVIKDYIEDDLNEDMDHWLEKHERGLFELEVYYQPTSCMTDCGIEYDMEMFMLDEKRGEV